MVILLKEGDVRSKQDTCSAQSLQTVGVSKAWLWRVMLSAFLQEPRPAMPSYPSSCPDVQQPPAHLVFGYLHQDSGLRQGNSLFRPDLDAFIPATYSILGFSGQSVVLMFLGPMEVASWSAKSVYLKVVPLWLYGALLMQVLPDHSVFMCTGWLHSACLPPQRDSSRPYIIYLLRDTKLVALKNHRIFCIGKDF